MKILTLNLRAFGPFTDAVLDLASGREGLHLVYGPNEAMSRKSRVVFASPSSSPRAGSSSSVLTWLPLGSGPRATG